MFNLKNQINLTIEENNLNLLEIKNAEKEQLIIKVKDVFVNDNPRALWQNLKYKPLSVKYSGEYPYLDLPKVLSNDEEYFFLIDDFNSDFHLFKGDLSAILRFIEECIGLDEYYLVNLNITKMVCETDHGDLLYIDINVNDQRLLDHS